MQQRNEVNKMSPLDNTYEKQFKVIGTRPPRPDGIEKVTGKAQYGADLYVPDMLYAKILRSHIHTQKLFRLIHQRQRS